MVELDERDGASVHGVSFGIFRLVSAGNAQIIPLTCKALHRKVLRWLRLVAF